MSKPRYLCDEHVENALRRGLTRLEPLIEITRVGRHGMPPIGTKDPELLCFAEDNGFILLTIDRNSMPQHIANHHAAGRHTAGVFILNPGHPPGKYLENLLMIWMISEAEEWRDRIEWLPW
jgi:hypothetical protein